MLCIYFQSIITSHFLLCLLKWAPNRIANGCSILWVGGCLVCSANLRRTNNEPTNCKFNIKLSNESMSNKIGAKYRRRLVVAYPSSFYQSCVVVSFCVVLVAVGIDGRLLVNVETAIRSMVHQPCRPLTSMVKSPTFYAITWSVLATTNGSRRGYSHLKEEEPNM